MKRWTWTLAVLLLLASNLTAAPARDEQAEAQAILDKAIKAIGGEEKLAKLTALSFHVRHNVYLLDGKTAEFNMTISYQLPNEKRIDVMGTLFNAKLDFAFVVTGDGAWIESRGGVRDLTKEQLAYYEKSYGFELEVLKLAQFKAKEYKLAPLEASKVDDKAAVDIKIVHDTRPETRYYFDRDTGLPLKLEFDKGGVKVEFFFEDYKELGGIKYPSKKRMHANGKALNEQVITECKIVEKFDDKTFAKPE